jgi:hypothetical protein
MLPILGGTTRKRGWRVQAIYGPSIHMTRFLVFCARMQHNWGNIESFSDGFSICLVNEYDRQYKYHEY